MNLLFNQSTRSLSRSTVKSCAHLLTQKYSAALIIGIITLSAEGQLWGQQTITFVDTDNSATAIDTTAPNDPTTLTIASGSAEQSGDVSGTGAVIKDGAGNLTLSGANTYTGGTTLSAGTLVIGNNAALGTGTFTIGDGTTVSVTSSRVVTNAVSLAGDFTFDGNSRQLSLRGGVDLGATTRRVTMQDTDSNLDIQGAISGTGGFTAGTGNGDIQFGGSTANTYSGLTTVENGGKLSLSRDDGVTAIAGDLVIDDGGTVLIFAGNQIAATSAVTVNGLLEFQTSSALPETIGSLTGVGQILNSSGSSTIEVGSGDFSGIIVGLATLKLVKNTAGTLTLSGVNYYNGSTEVNGGILSVGADNNLGRTSSDLSFDGGTLQTTSTFSTSRDTTLNAGGGSFSTDAATSLTHGGVISGSGTLDKTGAGTLELTGNNTYTGGTNLEAGSLLIDHNNALGTGALTIEDGTTLLSSTPRTITNAMVVNGDFSVFPGGTLLSISAFELDGDMDLTGGNRTITNTMNFNAFEFGQVNLGGVISNGGLTLASDLSHPQPNAVFFRIDGTEANTYTGDTIVGQGVSLTLDKSANVTAIAGDVSVQQDAVLVVLADQQIANTSNLTLAGNGRLQVGAGSDVTQSLASVNDDSSGLGSIDLNDDSTGSTVEIGSGSFSGTIEGGVAGGTSLVKSGTGTLTLSGDNTYLGDTDIEAGTLVVNGSHSGTGTTTVDSGATLGGSGSLAGAVTIANGGHLAPGTSPGTLSTGDLTLNATSQLDYELDTPDVVGGGVNDLVSVTGDLVLDGILNITDLGGFGDGTYRLFDYTGSLTDNGLLFGVVPAPFDLTVDVSTADQINLIVAAAIAQYWDGADTSPDGTIDGGAGTWNSSNTNWTNTAGNANTTWADLTAIFSGATGGTVNVDDTLAIAGLQFSTDAYLLNGTGELVISDANTAIEVDPALTATIATTLSGTGGILKNGTGTLVLSGTNTYTGSSTLTDGVVRVSSDANLGDGGDLVFQGGALNSTDTFTMNRDVVVNAAGGAIQVNSGTSLTIDGDITGTGLLEKQEAGDLILLGDASHTGGTTISAGTLQLGNGGTTGSITGDVTNNSALAFNRSDDITFADVISGTGSLTQAGAGTTTLTSSNTYTGGTTVSAGTLQIGNGGTTGSIAGDVTNNSTLAFNRSDDITVANVISGTGSLTQAGEGKTTLTGTNTYSGATNINAGTLLVNGDHTGTGAVTVNDGATLGGSGSLAGAVTVNDGGTLAPGTSPGILTVGSLNLEAGSATNLEVNGTTPGTEHDQLQVTGNATLGGDLNLAFAGADPVNGQSYTFIEADNITGDFANVILDYDKAIIYETLITNAYIFNIIGIETDFASFAFNDPELTMIAQLIDDNFADAGILPTINALNLLADPELASAFEQINPDELTALSGMTFANARNAVYRLGNRLREVRKGATGFSTAGFNLYDTNGQHIRQSLIAGSAIPASTQSQPYGDANESAVSYFVSGSATMLDVDGDSDGPGFEDDSFGLLLGADYRIASDLSLGIYGGYDHSDSDFGGNGGNADLDSYRLGLSGTWWTLIDEGRRDATQTFYTEAYLGGAYHEFDIVRSSFGGDAKGDTHATELDTGFAFGYEIEHSKWTFTTELSLDYIRLWLDGYNESGSTSPLEIDDDRSDSLYSTFSFRADYKLRLAEMDLRPYAQIGWRHQYLDTSESVTARFAGSAAGNFTVDGASTSRDSLIGSFGLSALLSEGFTAELGYYGEHNSQLEIHSINASLNFSF